MGGRLARNAFVHSSVAHAVGCPIATETFSTRIVQRPLQTHWVRIFGAIWVEDGGRGNAVWGLWPTEMTFMGSQPCNSFLCALLEEERRKRKEDSENRTEERRRRNEGRGKREEENTWNI